MIRSDQSCVCSVWTICSLSHYTWITLQTMFWFSLYSRSLNWQVNRILFILSSANKRNTEQKKRILKHHAGSSLLYQSSTAPTSTDYTRQKVLILLGMLWTWRQKPKSISCWPTLYSHWTHSFPDYSLYCLQLSVFKPSTLHHWEAHVHVHLLCPHILEHPQNIHLSCLFPCLGGYCGLSVWVCLCLLSCRVLNMPPLPLTYHCTLQTLCF